ncbi:hypothetical protein RA19_17275 [Leisingera sp. ANG-M1]|nr:hypothetical protein RA19_17275 [Leisingera sp. ANG-M1]
MINNLGEDTSVHWHGQILPFGQDGTQTKQHSQKWSNGLCGTRPFQHVGDVLSDMLFHIKVDLDRKLSRQGWYRSAMGTLPVPETCFPPWLFKKQAPETDIALQIRGGCTCQSLINPRFGSGLTVSQIFHGASKRVRGWFQRTARFIPPSDRILWPLM